MTKQMLLSRSAIILSGFLMAGTAFAADSMTHPTDAMTNTSSDSMKPSLMMMMHPPAPMILNVNPSGKGTIRGVVASVSATSITVAGWGGIWTIQTNANTNILPSGVSLSGIKVGDYVGAMGTVSENGPTMTATSLRDRTMKSATMNGSDKIKKHGDAMTNTSMTH